MNKNTLLSANFSEVGDIPAVSFCGSYSLLCPLPISAIFLRRFLTRLCRVLKSRDWWDTQPCCAL